MTLQPIRPWRYWQCLGCDAITTGAQHENPCPDCGSPTFCSPPILADSGDTQPRGSA